MSDNINNWYSAPDYSGWYAQSAPEAPKAPAKKPRKKRTGMKVTMIILCVLVLVAASAVLFSGAGSDWTWSFHVGSNPQLSQPSPAPDPVDPDKPSDKPSLPAETEPPQDSNDSDGDGFPDDYHDFFDSFYIAAEETLPSNMESLGYTPDIELELVSSNGKKVLDYDELYAKCIDSVVGIMALYDGVDGYGWGSGVVLTSDGYILTNSHVISEADDATVVLSDGREYPAKLVGEDTQSDIAILKIPISGLTPAQFGISTELSIGSAVVAIGNPLGREFSGTMTNGIISAIDRDMDYNGATMTLLQTNAAINEGNSGGPLFNMYGQVIGITNMKMVNSSDVTIEGIGFAIPSATVKEIADQLLSKGQVTGRPGIGITCGMIPDAAVEVYNLAHGLYIIDVVPNCDAAAKGIQPGDILTHINGTPVYTTEDVLTIRDGFGVGDVLTFTIFREGKSFDVDVELYDQNQLK